MLPALFVAFVLAVVLGAGAAPAAAADPACGAYVGDKHIIQTPEQLAAIGSGTAGDDCDPARTYRLDRSITVAARDSAVVATTFTGTLEGGGHTVTLAIDRTTEDGARVGLFASLDGATITGLRLDGSVRTAGSGAVGALAGAATGTTTVTDSSFTVDVTGRSEVGGIIGRADSGTVSFAQVQVGTGADAVELRGVSSVGGIVGLSFSAVDIGIATVHVQALPQSRSGLNTRFFGGLIGSAQASVTVDGSAAGVPHGVEVTFELFGHLGPTVSEVGGVGGRLSSGNTVVRGVAVELDVIITGDAVGGIAGALINGGGDTTTIGGPDPEHAVSVTGSIVGGSAAGDRAAGIATIHFSTGAGTTVRGFTMAATVAAFGAGGLYTNVNGTLSIEDTVVSGAVTATLSAGGITTSVSSAQLSLRNVTISSEIRADQVGGIAENATGDAAFLVDGVTVSGTLRSNAAATDGFRGVGGMFMILTNTSGDGVTPFIAPPVFDASGATIIADFPDGTVVGNAVLRVAGLVPILGSGFDAAVVTGTPATVTVTVSDAKRDSGRCLVASRVIRSLGPSQHERFDPLSPDPCPLPEITTSGGGGVGGSGDEGTPGLVCSWTQLAVGAQVTCEVSGGPSGTELLWHAVVNPVVAGGSVLVNGTGTGAFTFVVPRAALGLPLSVELVEWREPMLLGTVTGVIPTSIPAGVPAGDGPWASGGSARSLAGLLALALGLSVIGAGRVGLGRLGRRPDRAAVGTG